MGFKTGETVVVKQGQGYWDCTDYPYGGCFKRASSAFGVTVVGPGGKYPQREYVVNAAGRKLVVDGNGLASIRCDDAACECNREQAIRPVGRVQCERCGEAYYPLETLSGQCPCK